MFLSSPRGLLKADHMHPYVRVAWSKCNTPLSPYMAIMRRIYGITYAVHIGITLDVALITGLACHSSHKL